MTTVKVRAESGKFAIYTGTDDLPFTAPRSYLSRTGFHSDLDYLSINPAKTITATVTRIATDSGRSRTITLGAHGSGGVPMVQGFVTIAGLNVPLCGSVPVYSSSAGNCILWTLCVDETNVYIHEQRSAPTLGSATNFDVTVYVTTKLVA